MVQFSLLIHYHSLKLYWPLLRKDHAHLSCCFQKDGQAVADPENPIPLRNHLTLANAFPGNTLALGLV